jgi:hypothetical protein
VLSLPRITCERFLSVRVATHFSSNNTTSILPHQKHLALLSTHRN